MLVTCIKTYSVNHTHIFCTFANFSRISALSENSVQRIFLNVWDDRAKTRKRNIFAIGPNSDSIYINLHPAKSTFQTILDEIFIVQKLKKDWIKNVRLRGSSFSNNFVDSSVPTILEFWVSNPKHAINAFSIDSQTLVLYLSLYWGKSESKQKRGQVLNNYLKICSC